VSFVKCPSSFESILQSRYDSITYMSKSSPRFNRLYRALKHADRRIERANKFLRKTQTAKARSIENAKCLPENATIREEYVKCGKPFCLCEHGPYYYAYWIDSSTKKLNKKYIGNYFQQAKENIQNSGGRSQWYDGE
jgi:hypothetical protein